MVWGSNSVRTACFGTRAPRAGANSPLCCTLNCTTSCAHSCCPALSGTLRHHCAATGFRRPKRGCELDASCSGLRSSARLPLCCAKTSEAMIHRHSLTSLENVQMMKRKHRIENDEDALPQALAILEVGMLHNPSSACLAQVRISFSHELIPALQPLPCTSGPTVHALAQARGPVWPRPSQTSGRRKSRYQLLRSLYSLVAKWNLLRAPTPSQVGDC